MTMNATFLAHGDPETTTMILARHKERADREARQTPNGWAGCDIRAVGMRCKGDGDLLVGSRNVDILHLGIHK